MHTYVITNASFEVICVEFERNKQHWLFYFQTAHK